MKITEDQLEQQCIAWFQNQGYETLYGPDIAHDGDNPIRADYREVVLKDRLLAQLRVINPQFPVSALEDAVHTVVNPESPVMIHNNRAFHKLLLEGVPVEFSDGDEMKNDHVQLIDFNNPDNNRFCVVNQFTVQGARKPRRPDLVVFINGLPVAVSELKNPADESADVWSAFNQFQTYKDEIGDLFVYNTALVISDGITARIGSLTADQERFMPWRTIRDENDKPLLEYELEKVVRGFFDKELFLDYMRHFVLFEQDDGKTIKKIAGYHQFHAVRSAVKTTVKAAIDPDIGTLEVHEERATYGKDVIPGSKKAGVVWHTQGSGKSITMCCYAGKLLQQQEMCNPTLVVVTDREDLDGQLFGTFCEAQALLKQMPIRIGDEKDGYPALMPGRERLRDALAQRQAGGIYFTTVQKFALLNGEGGHPVLNERHNIVVISDEAHRSQYGLKARLNEKTGEYIYGYAKHMRDALPNASFIGFTGTPISMADKDTQAVFGDYVSIYDIQDAVDDGATVPIYYESRLAKLDINHAAIQTLNEDVDEVIEDEEDLGAREGTKSQWATLEKLVGAQPRMDEVAADLVSHFEKRTASIDGKAMIVGMSREICVQLYRAITALRPDWHDDDPEKGAIKVIMTGSASDKELLQPHIYSKQVKKRIEKRFKNPSDPLKLVIVRDMWLTGFDAPCCHTMYVDKPMKGHNLMQAIARVNRVFKDKPGGLVVDYIGIANELKQALKTYTESNGKGSPTQGADQALSFLLEKLDVIRGMMHGFDYCAFETDAVALLLPVANHILGLNEGKKRFLDMMTALTRAFSLCSTLDAAAELRTEIAFFSAVKSAIVKHTTVDKKRSEASQHSALKQILDNAIVSQGVDDVFELAGLNKPNVGLLSDEFLDDVRKMPARNLAVELLEKLLRDEIRHRMRNDVVQEKNYSDRLMETLRKYHNRAIETAQVIEELIAMAKDMQHDSELTDQLGLNVDELAFYHALADNESAVRELGDDQLKGLAQELTEKLRKSTTVDWEVRESVRAKLRTLIRRALKRWKYPPDKAAEAVELVLKQAERLCPNWI